MNSVSYWLGMFVGAVIITGCWILNDWSRRGTERRARESRDAAEGYKVAINHYADLQKQTEARFGPGSAGLFISLFAAWQRVHQTHAAQYNEPYEDFHEG